MTPHEEDTQAWLKKASIDIRAAEVDMEAEPPLLEDVLFNCQQAAEKSLNAFLVWKDHPFQKTHSIEDIGEKCIKYDRELIPLIDRAVPLTIFAWTFRYPGGMETPEENQAADALRTAKEVYEAILSRLPENVHPE